VTVCASALADALRPRLSSAVILSGPAPAPLARAEGYYRRQILLRSPSARSIVEPLRQALREFRFPAKVTASVDVDAVSLM
jgi:primosomal protein N'